MAKILIADDQPSNREVLRTLLGYKGHRVLEAADGEQALEIAKAEHPDLGIIDLLMPVMDGFEFVRRLRQEPKIGKMPVVFFTATYYEEGARELAAACGVEHIITKPAEPEQILAVLEAVLKDSPATVAAPHEEQFERKHMAVVSDKLHKQAATLEAVSFQLRTLIEITRQMAQETNPTLVLEKFCHVARDIIGAGHAVIAILNSETGIPNRFFASGMETVAITRITSSPEILNSLRQMVASSQAVRLQSSSGSPQELLPGHPPMSSLLGTHIASPAGVYGFLCLIDKLGNEGFSEQDEELLSALAAAIALVYENAGRYSEIQRKSAELEREIAERRRAQEALETASGQLRNLFDNLDDVFFSVDTVQQRVLLISPACEKVYGLPQRALLHNPTFWKEVVHPEDKPKVEEQEATVVAGRTGDCEYRIVRPDGTVSWVESRIKSTMGPAGRLVRLDGVISDVTERKQLEEQLRLSQKMEGIGQLAGGVAHDFNNLLTVINGYSELVMSQLNPADPMIEGLGQVKRAGERAAALTRQLLAFSRKQVLEPRLLDLNLVVKDVDKMLRRLIGEDIEFVTVLELNLKRVRADPGQIEQVLMNLAVNARDAMPQGGKLTIETQAVELDEDYAVRHVGIRPGTHVMLAVSDTGCGIDEDTKARIFEPFFTTKDQGKGTGLGLAVVYGIIKQSGGSIWVYSEPGHGTTFKIYLPCVSDSEKPLHQRQPESVVVGGAETILLVEDETAVRKLALTGLQAKGYNVFEAANGTEAMAICDSYSGQIDLLVTDIVMPLVSGRQVAEHLQSKYPDIRVLYMSGYTDEAVIRHGILDVGMSFLQKPFTPRSLARKVRQVLDHANRASAQVPEK